MRIGMSIRFGIRVGFALAAVAILTACATDGPPPFNPIDSAQQSQMSFEVFLVRHAEKTTEKTDPDLTVNGYARAERLADMLEDAGIQYIHSSDYKRTRETAAPLAKRLGLEVEIYDPRDLQLMSNKLTLRGGKHLVVGHSNTTPQLTEALGGDGGSPIVEATEYNRLYFVTRSRNGDVSSTLLRFGQSSESVVHD